MQSYIIAVAKVSCWHYMSKSPESHVKNKSLNSQNESVFLDSNFQSTNM